MQSVELPGADQILREISRLLATAWERRARLRLMAPVSDAQPSTNAVDKTAPPSPHEMTLTRRRKEAARS
jgi:hypothetical protein